MDLTPCFQRSLLEVYWGFVRGRGAHRVVHAERLGGFVCAACAFPLSARTLCKHDLSVRASPHARSIPSCSRDLSARVNFSYSHAPCLRCLLLLARPRLDGDLLALSSQQVCPVGGLIPLSSQLVCPVGGLIPLSSHSVLFKNALSGFLPKNGMKNGQIWEESCISLR